MQKVTVPPEHSIEGLARLLTCTDGATMNTTAVEQYDAANGVWSTALNVAQATLVINVPSAVAAVARTGSSAAIPSSAAIMNPLVATLARRPEALPPLFARLRLTEI